MINALRAHLAEFGITAAQGREGITELLAIVVQDEGSRLPVDARASLTVLAAQLQAVQTMIGSLEKRIVAQHRSNEASKRLETIPGIGVIGATTIAAVVPDWECSLKGPGRRPVPQVINSASILSRAKRMKPNSLEVRSAVTDYCPDDER